MVQTMLKQRPTPKAAANLRNAAMALMAIGRSEEAAERLRALLKLDARDVYALYTLAQIHVQRQQFKAALARTEAGVQAAPGFAPLWFAHAIALRGVGDDARALAAYERAIQLQPDFVSAWQNSGVLLSEMLRHEQALERFERVLKLDPGHLAALANSATLLARLGRSGAAIARWQALVALDPDHPWALGALAHEQLRLCDWSGYEAGTARIVQRLADGKPVCKTLALMPLSDRAEDHLRCARLYAAVRHGLPEAALWRGERYGHARLRLAYVSPDFGEHPVCQLMAGVWEHHDRQRFETIAISVGVDDHSAPRRRAEAAFDRFIDAAALSSPTVARLIRELEVDILVDLAGYTTDARIEIFAHRPAPLQITWLGHPGTLGTGFFDAILADRHVIPEHQQHLYAEPVARLPDCYLPTDASLRASAATPTRAQSGLPETGAVFCAFGQAYKIEPRSFASWMRLLQQAAGSVLWLNCGAGVARANLQREAALQGVAPERLVFADRLPRIEDHLARYRLADVFVDTFNYNAHTTAADALAAGLPVVTLSGDSFPSRVAGSLLHAIGLPELVAANVAQYEALALRLASDADFNAQTRARLQTNRATHPLFDTARFTRGLEDTLQGLHARRLAALAE